MIEQAIAAALAKGLRTADIASPGTQTVGTAQMGDAIIAEMEKLLRGKSSRVDGICHYADFTQSGDSVNYTMTCRLGDDEQTSAVSATYRGDSATGTIRSAGVTVTASSRRIGSCTESSFAR